MSVQSFFATDAIEASLPQHNLPQLPELLSTPTDDALLREQIRQIDGDKVKRLAVLSFRSLQLHRIAKLQAELIKKQNASINPPHRARSFQKDDKLSTKDKLKCESENEERENKEIDGLLQRYGAFGRG